MNEDHTGFPQGRAERGIYRRSGQRVFWGPDALDSLPGELERARASRPLIVCGASVRAHPTLLPHIIDVLSGSPAGVFSAVRQHTPLDSVEEVRTALEDAGADSVVVVGGGSALVTARAACILHGEGRPLTELATYMNADDQAISPRLTQPKLPIIALPTTPTTAVCKAGTAVTVPGRDGRLAMYDPKTRSRSILLDPEFLDSSPVRLVRDATLNAFVMAVDGLATGRSHVFSDAMLVYAIRRLTILLPKLAEGEVGPRDRVDAALSSILVGDGTDTTGGGLTAALSHTIGHHYHAHNGSIDAILLPHALDAISPTPSAWSLIADSLGGQPAEASARLRDLLASSGAPRALREVGVQLADAHGLAEEATSDFSYRRSQSKLDTSMVADVIRAAW